MRAREDRPQTIKQAKAAFKARGSTSVSDADKRRLERGAQLLERASRVKEQEQRRRELQKKREDKIPKEQQIQKPPLLGTQRRLDKFGYKSSQLHLGAFLKAARPSIPTEKESASPEPWDDDDDDEDVDDDTLLDIAAEFPIQQTKQTIDTTTAVQPVASQPTKEPACHACEDLEHWDDFFESSTQLARELSDETVQNTPALYFSSFGSTDFDISAEDLEELDASVHNVTPKPTSSTIANGKRDMPPSLSPALSLDRKLMPPPSLPLQPKQQKLTARNKYSASCTDSGTSLVRFSDNRPTNISLADLESIAHEDIELSQFSA